MDYWILMLDSQDGAVIDAYPPGGPPDHHYDRGVPLAPVFPKGASVRFSKNFPDLRKLEDFQPNILNALIVSPRVREVLTKLDVPGLEILPVALRNHRDEVVGPDHAFVNPLGSQPAIDMERSKYRMGSLDKTQINRVKDLVLDRKAIDPAAMLFRCTTYLRLFLVRDDLAKAFQSAGLTGYRLVEPDGWDGLEI